MRTLYNQIAGDNLERISALSDGVFAIAMTILVLDLHVPFKGLIHTETTALHALRDVLPQLIAYVMAFLTLGIFWMGQQVQLNHLKKSDRNFAWIHIMFLLCVSLVPFSTAFLAEFIASRTALIVYWFNVFLLGLVLYWSWVYALNAGLVKDDVGPEIDVATRRRIVVAQFLYFVAALLCFINTYVSIAGIFLIQLNYALAPKIRFLYRL